jgi:hypothetical protein
MLVALRLMSPDMAVEETAVQARIARTAGAADWAKLLAGYREARAVITDWLMALGLAGHRDGDDDGNRFTGD